MIVYYAIGGGLGHLVRARAFLYTSGLEGSASILTASRFADDLRVVGRIPVIRVEGDLAGNLTGFQKWLQNKLEELQPEEIFLDTFPAGIIGELCPPLLLPDVPIHYAARRLRWQEYRHCIQGDLPQFTATYLLEPLEPEHDQFIHDHSDLSVPLVLRDPPHDPTPEEKELIRSLAARDCPLWIVVHSGPPGEVLELLAYAREMRQVENSRAEIALLSQELPDSLPPSIKALDLYPASLLFRVAERVISGSGFNIMRQMAAYRAKHYFIPFARRFDDQFARSTRLRRSGHGIR